MRKPVQARGVSCSGCGEDNWTLVRRQSGHRKEQSFWRCRWCHAIASELSRRRRGPVSTLLRAAKRRARRKGLPFTLRREDIVIPTHCPVLGVPLVVGDAMGPTPYSPTLDRLIPERGYVPDNIRVISHKANRIKSDATLDELRAVVRYMEEIYATERP